MPALPHASIGGEFGASLSVPSGEKLLVYHPFSCTLDKLKSSEMCCISFIQGQKSAQLDWTGMTRVILSSPCAVDLLGSCHPDARAKVALWLTRAHSLGFQELSQILATVFS